ncbi:hypothetical protein JMN32_11755 [Fulvivirga sp. 29W222]|uniref:Uncharacterized protein n=1 Tax=Fulvivirga marina TaxID=2494733 RepID=A0A937KC51_9BACT|nr:hypothetical protein [Fulvivirga marina]MBL6446989.1 hypothetical protein [Fulvivirga marina]
MKATMKTLMTLMLGIALIACDPLSVNTVEPALSDDSNITSPTLIAPGVEFCGEPQEGTLFAENDIYAGTVTIYNDEINLYVTVYSIQGFLNINNNVRLWAGTDLNLMPQNLYGIPNTGLFPYKATVNGTEHTFAVPLAGIPGYNSSECGSGSVYLVLNADVLVDNGYGGIGVSSAYGGGVKVDGSVPWYYSIYTPRCCETPPPPSEGTCETAFGKFDKTGGFGTGYVFTTGNKCNPESYASLALTKNRWGWAGNFTADGTYTFDVWAGAGLNNTAKGTLVGTVTITMTGNSVEVTYNLSGYSLQEVHIYIGDFMPTTLAPGQYGYNKIFGPLPSDYPTTHAASFTVNDTNGDGIWIIAHTVVFGEF